MVAKGPERLLTALVLDEPARWKSLQERLSLGEDVTEPALRRILSVVSELDATGHSATPAQVVSRLSEEGHGALVTELVELASSVASRDEALEDCVRRLQANARARHLAQLREQLRAAQDAGQDADVQQLLAEYQEQLSTPQGG